MNVYILLIYDNKLNIKRTYLYFGKITCVYECNFN